MATDQIGSENNFMVQTPFIIAITGLFELQILVPFESNKTVRYFDLVYRTTNTKFILRTAKKNIFI